MVKKGFNWKSRQVVDTIIDDSATKKIALDLKVTGHYDQSNELVLPSEKRKTKIKKVPGAQPRLLSRKHRKKLEKIVEKKLKKANRASLLDALAQVKAQPDELSQLTSIASMQTKGLKRYFNEEFVNSLPPPHSDHGKKRAKLQPPVQLNSIKGSRTSVIAVDKMAAGRHNTQLDDPNVVGLEESSDDDDDDNDDDNDCVIHHQDDCNNKNDVKEPEPVKIEETAVTTVVDTTSSSSHIIVGSTDNKIVNTKKKKVLGNTDTDTSKPAVFVDLIRDEVIQAARMKLPILAEEQRIMELINDNSIVIVAGETGSGKTTQLPQFLYEAGYALSNRQIVVTEPRRVAAIAMSKRVAHEMNLTCDEVSYLIRFEGNVTDRTRIKFMTDGVLLKEIQNDFLLTKYSVVILDEAHERSVFTDILIGLLSRIVPLRMKRGNPLKLIIMSATLRLEDFTMNRRLFKVAPPVINVDARQFPVTVHFNRRTRIDYVREAFSKACKIHQKLPDGGILIFLTGQLEVCQLVRKLKKAFPYKMSKNKNMKSNQKTSKKNQTKIGEKINLDDFSVVGDLDLDDENDSDIDSDDLSDSEEIVSNLDSTKPLWVLPLYSMLPSHKQARVFDEPPSTDCRLCVVSTNVAETSLTIPHIKYVIDSGKTKTKLYDKITGVTSYTVTWTSKASANQRAGRAGRLGPGHCYRLYSSAVFNDSFYDFNAPEIQRKPVDDLYLQMKCMNIEKICNFPFPTAPDLMQLKAAESRLKSLGALDASSGRVTDLGRAIARFPVQPRYGKMLALSHQHDLLPYTICLVAALSVQQVLLDVDSPPPTSKAKITTDSTKIKSSRDQWSLSRRQSINTSPNSLLLGDNMVLLKSVLAAELANHQTNSNSNLVAFCNTHALRAKAIVEIRKLRVQLSEAIKCNLPQADCVVDPKLAPPNDLQAKLLRQILLSGLGDQIAKHDNDPINKYAYHANNMDECVHLHRASVLRRTRPEFVIYQEIYETNTTPALDSSTTTTGETPQGKIFIRGVTAIEPEWLPVYVPSLCNLSEPLLDPEPYYENGRVRCTVIGTFGTQAWPLGHVQIDYPMTLDRFRWFARFLLDGRVFKKLRPYVGVLLSPPGIMVKSWGKLQPRTEAVLKTLMGMNCSTRDQLVDVWRVQPKCLLLDYLKWLPESAHSEVSLMWPPID